jgi:hypothetical protein
MTPLSPAVLDRLWRQMLAADTSGVLADMFGLITFDGMWAVRVERAKRGSRR